MESINLHLDYIHSNLNVDMGKVDPLNHESIYSRVKKQVTLKGLKILKRFSLSWRPTSSIWNFVTTDLNEIDPLTKKKGQFGWIQRNRSI